MTLQEQWQEKRVDDLLELIQEYSKKANEKGYEATPYDRARFDQIVHLVNWMKEWL